MNNGSQTAPERAAIPGEVDWALADIPDGVNATGLLADDLEEYAGSEWNRYTDRYRGTGSGTLYANAE